MTVTVHYTSGASEVFTSCTDFTISGDVVTIVGTDAAGVSATYKLRWSLITKISQQGD